ncbi:hypothetical protein V1281_005373 [Nitrobacteraceae bacterium AZCC 2161]
MVAFDIVTRHGTIAAARDGKFVGSKGDGHYVSHERPLTAYSAADPAR